MGSISLVFFPFNMCKMYLENGLQVYVVNLYLNSEQNVTAQRILGCVYQERSEICKILREKIICVISFTKV